MRSTTAFFAGAGTVVAAIAAGLGGGYLFFSIVSPHPEKHGSSEVTRLERRMSSDPIPADNKGSPEPVPYLDSPQVSAAVAEPPSPPKPAPEQPQQPAAQPQPQQQQQQAAQSQPPQPQQTPAKPASTQPAAAPPAPPPAAQPAAAEQQATREKSAADDSYARARDADVKRDARRAEERRKGERDRRQQWSERRKWRQRDDDRELVEVERRVREDTEPRRFREDDEPQQLFASEPTRIESPRFGMPRIRLFDMD